MTKAVCSKVTFDAPNLGARVLCFVEGALYVGHVTGWTAHASQQTAPPFVRATVARIDSDGDARSVEVDLDCIFHTDDRDAALRQLLDQ
jgi:hypothetical protein